MGGIYFVSALTGLIFGAASYGVMLLMQLEKAGLWALVCGLWMFATVLSLLLLNARRLERRRADAARQLPSPATHHFTANLYNGQRIAPVEVFLCEKELCLITLEQTSSAPQIIPAADLVRAAIIGAAQLQLTLAGGRIILLKAVQAYALLQALQQRGWIRPTA